MRSDLFRATTLVVVTIASGAGLVHAAPDLREAGLLPTGDSGPELVYTILNLTEDMQAIGACPIDLTEAQRATEIVLRRERLRPVYSPIAGGPDVLTQEFAASLATGECEWTAQTVFQGQTYASLRDAARAHRAPQLTARP
jgi:hypothetical protein